MEPKLIPIVFALACVALSPLVVDAAELCDSNADCASPDECIGGACVPPVPDPNAYVTDAMTRWSSNVWAVQFPALFEPDPELCCFDYTGDGVPDDAFGGILGLMIVLGEDPVGSVDSALENGELVKVFDWRELAPDLASGDVQLSVFDGLWTDSTAHADRILGLGHTAFRRSSFGSYGALDQLNAGTVTTELVEVAGNHFTLTLPEFFLGGDMASVHLLEPRLEAPVSYGEPLRDACLGLCSVDEDRGAGHTPQIVGGGKLGGVITADEILTHLDAFYRQCACAGIDPNMPVIEWEANTGTGTFDISCTSNTGDPSLCDPDDTCSDLDMICSTMPLLTNTLDVDLDGDGIRESWSIGLRLGFAGTTLDPMPELFADGFESGDTSAWSNGSIAFVTSTPYYSGDDISWISRIFCQSGNCPWSPPDQLHDGIDFAPIGDLVGFRSGCDGTVSAVELYFNPGNGFYQGNVIIECSADSTGGLVYAFEPMSPDIAVGNEQMAQLAVDVGVPVVAGGPIGALVVTGPDSHLHWGVISEFTQVCPEPHLTPPVAVDLLTLIQRDNPTWNICH